MCIKRKKQLFFAVIATVIAAITLLLSACDDGEVTPPPKAKDFSSVCSLYADNVVEVAVGNTFGTGFVISCDGQSADIATCYHVAGSDPGAVRFKFNGENAFVGGENVSLIGYDVKFDVAFYRVQKPGCKALDLISPAENSVAGFRSGLTAAGTKVIVMGNSMGRGTAAFDGIVSVDEEIELFGGYYKPLLRVTAAIDGGSSGAPVIDADGKVIGMGVGKYKSSADGAGNVTVVTGMNYVTPAEIVMALYNKAVSSDAAEIGRPDVSFTRGYVTEENVTREEVTVKITKGDKQVAFIWQGGIMTLKSSEGLSAEAGAEYSKFNGKSLPSSITELTATIIETDEGAGLEFSGEGVSIRL